MDEARWLPRMREGGGLVERTVLRRGQADALLAAIADTPSATVRTVKAEPGDLRGIPVIGPGVGGVSPGSSPTSAIARVDRERGRAKPPREPMVGYV